MSEKYLPILSQRQQQELAEAARLLKKVYLELYPMRPRRLATKNSSLYARRREVWLDFLHAVSTIGHMANDPDFISIYTQRPRTELFHDPKSQLRTHA